MAWQHRRQHLHEAPWHRRQGHHSPRPRWALDILFRFAATPTTAPCRFPPAPRLAAALVPFGSSCGRGCMKIGPPWPSNSTGATLPRRSMTRPRQPPPTIERACRVAATLPSASSPSMSSAIRASPAAIASTVGERPLPAHRPACGQVVGFETKNRRFTGFATGGRKTYWSSAVHPDDDRLVLVETAIDAFSYHQLFPHLGSRYISTGGAIGPDARALIGARSPRYPQAPTS